MAARPPCCSKRPEQSVVADVQVVRRFYINNRTKYIQTFSNWFYFFILQSLIEE